MWGCVWSQPPPGSWHSDDEMETQKEPEWASNNWPYPLSACSQQRWEALAKKTLLTHEEGTVNCPLSSNYCVKLRPKT